MWDKEKTTSSFKWDDSGGINREMLLEKQNNMTSKCENA